MPRSLSDAQICPIWWCSRLDLPLTPRSAFRNAGRLAVLVPRLSQAHSWLDISPVFPSSCQETLGPSCAVFTGLVISVKSVAQPCLDSLEVICEEQ